MKFNMCQKYKKKVFLALVFHGPWTTVLALDALILFFNKTLYWHFAVSVLIFHTVQWGDLDESSYLQLRLGCGLELRYVEQIHPLDRCL